MRIIHRNAIDDYILTATLAESGYPVSNLQDLTLAKKWRSPVFNNLIDRPDCESLTPPMIFDETVPVAHNVTFERFSNGIGSTYSYKITKTNASGSLGYLYIVDTESPTDMHGFIAGYTYTFSAWVYVSTAGGMDLNEVFLTIWEYYGGEWHLHNSSSPTAKDEWQKISVTVTLNAGTTGVILRLLYSTTVDTDEFFYVDDIRLDDVPQIKIDAGSNNVISVKSFAIGGHNLTGGAKITIEGNNSADFGTPDHSDELTRNLIINPEDLTTSEWVGYYNAEYLTNMYVKNRRLTKCVATSALYHKFYINSRQSIIS